MAISSRGAASPRVTTCSQPEPHACLYCYHEQRQQQRAQAESMEAPAMAPTLSRTSSTSSSSSSSSSLRRGRSNDSLPSLSPPRAPLFDDSDDEDEADDYSDSSMSSSERDFLVRTPPDDFEALPPSRKDVAGVMPLRKSSISRPAARDPLLAPALNSATGGAALLEKAVRAPACASSSAVVVTSTFTAASAPSSKAAPVAASLLTRSLRAAMRLNNLKSEPAQQQQQPQVPAPQQQPGSPRLIEDLFEYERFDARRAEGASWDRLGWNRGRNAAALAAASIVAPATATPCDCADGTDCLKLKRRKHSPQQSVAETVAADVAAEREEPVSPIMSTTALPELEPLEDDDDDMSPPESLTYSPPGENAELSPESRSPAVVSAVTPPPVAPVVRRPKLLANSAHLRMLALEFAMVRHGKIVAPLRQRGVVIAHGADNSPEAKLRGLTRPVSPSTLRNEV